MPSHPDPGDQGIDILALCRENKREHAAYLVDLLVVFKWVVVGHFNMLVTRFELVHLV